MNKRQHAYYLGTAFLGSALSASAYIVYFTTVARTGLSVPASFFWFSLFAALAAFLYPDDLAGDLTGNHPGLRERLRKLYPDWPWRTWYRVTAKSGRFDLIGASSIAGILYFLLMLSALQAKQTNIVVTVVVLQQANPLLCSYLGYRFLGDTCKSWGAYVAGAAIIAVGIIFYKYDLQATGGTRFFDKVFWFLVGVAILDAASLIYRALYRRRAGVDALEAMRTTQVVSTVAALLICLATGSSLAITPWQLLGSAYLGIVPTAIGGILRNRAQDKIGVPWVMSIGALRPIYILLWGFVPFAIFATDARSLSYNQMFGIILACIGLVVVYAIAKPQPVSPAPIPPKEA